MNNFEQVFAPAENMEFSKKKLPSSEGFLFSSFLHK